MIPGIKNGKNGIDFLYIFLLLLIIIRNIDIKNAVNIPATKRKRLYLKLIYKLFMRKYIPSPFPILSPLKTLTTSITNPNDKEYIKSIR